MHPLDSGRLIRFGWPSMLVAAILFAAATIPFVTGSYDSAATFVVEPDHLNFGQLGQFDRPSLNLVIQNPQSVDMNLIFRADCSCVSVDRYRATLLPGESQKFQVAIDRAGAGENEDGVRAYRRTLEIVYSDGGVSRVAVVPLAAEFVEPVVVDPASAVLKAYPFQRCETSIGISGTVGIDRLAVQAFELDGITLANRLDGRVAWNAEFNAGTLHVECDRLDNLDGQLECLLEVGSAEKGTSTIRTVRIPIRMVRLDPLVVVPDLIVATAENSGCDVQFSLHPDSSVADFEIVKVNAQPDGWNVVLVDKGKLRIERSEDRKSEESSAIGNDVEDRLAVEVRLKGSRGEIASWSRSIPFVQFD